MKERIQYAFLGFLIVVAFSWICVNIAGKVGFDPFSVPIPASDIEKRHKPLHQEDSTEELLSRASSSELGDLFLHCTATAYNYFYLILESK